MIEHSFLVEGRVYETSTWKDKLLFMLLNRLQLLLFFKF